MSKRRDDFQSIQFLRGIAAFMVVVFHTICADNYLSADSTARNWAQYGARGVQVFFIISGFIIPYSMYKASYVYSDFKVFMAKRIIRIEPPYIISIVMYLLLNYSNTLSPWYSGPAYHVDWGNILGHLAYINAFTGAPWINEAYWTLAVEFEYYILLSLLYPLLVNKNKIVAFVTFIVMLAGVYLPLGSGHIFYHLPFFLFGIALFYYQVGIASLRQFLCLFVATAVICGLNYELYYLLISIATLICIVSIKKVSKVFLWLGAISYSLYLIHSAIPGRVIGLFDRFTGNTNKALSIFIALIVTLIISYCFYRMFEKPFQKLSKKIKLHKGDGQDITPQPLPIAAS